MPPQSSQPDFPASSQQPPHDPYDFFMGSQKKHKKGLPGGLGGASLPLKLLIGALCAMFLVIIVVVVLSFFSGGKDTTTPLVAIARDQQELIRVSTLGSKSVGSTQLKNFAATAQASLTTAQQQLITRIQRSGTKVDTKLLTSTDSATTNEALTAALAANTYDVTFTTVMQTGLTDYLNKLETAAGASASKSEKLLLSNQAAQAKLLIQQLGNQ